MLRPDPPRYTEVLNAGRRHPQSRHEHNRSQKGSNVDNYRRHATASDGQQRESSTANAHFENNERQRRAQTCTASRVLNRRRCGRVSRRGRRVRLPRMGLIEHAGFDRSPRVRIALPAARGSAAWTCRMLNVGKLAAGPGAGRYYVDQVAQGREDYYAGEGEAPGAWMGGGAAAARPVGRGRARRASCGCSRGATRPRASCSRRAAHGRVGRGLRPDVPRAEEREHPVRDRRPGGRRERSSRRTTRRSPKRWRTWSARRAGRAAASGGAIVVKGRGFVGAAFRHRSSRAGDPLLHTHVVDRERDAGRGRALDGARRPRLYRHAKTARLPLPGGAARAS